MWWENTKRPSWDKRDDDTQFYQDAPNGLIGVGTIVMLILFVLSLIVVSTPKPSTPMHSMVTAVYSEYTPPVLEIYMYAGPFLIHGLDSNATFVVQCAPQDVRATVEVYLNQYNDTHLPIVEYTENGIHAYRLSTTVPVWFFSADVQTAPVIMVSVAGVCFGAACLWWVVVISTLYHGGTTASAIVLDVLAEIEIQKSKAEYGAVIRRTAPMYVMECHDSLKSLLTRRLGWSVDDIIIATQSNLNLEEYKDAHVIPTCTLVVHWSTAAARQQLELETACPVYDNTSIDVPLLQDVE
jgi:hypothetical protein